MYLTEQETEILTAALDTIRDEEHWCKGVLAVNKDREPILKAGDPEAVAWCASGALILHLYGTVSLNGWYRSLCSLEDKLDELSYEMFPPENYDTYDGLGQSVGGNLGHRYIRVNDVLGHDAIVSLFEKALVKL